jgi:hypothetical protein
MGIRGRVSRNTLSHANATRDWRIFQDFASLLIPIAKELYLDSSFGLELKETAYALDATTIDLCLSLFPWAQYRQKNAGLKVHTLMDLRGSIPTIVIITGNKVHEVNILDQLYFEPGAFYVMDRGYLDFARLYRIQLSGAFFVIRPRKDFTCRRLYSQPVDRTSGVVCDQIITLCSFYTKKGYPQRLRRIKYWDEESNRRFVFLTNNFELSPLLIAQLYRCRWQVELFFKWIKQHLRIKKFYGISENALKTQIWIAITVYLLVAIVKKRLQLEEVSLYTILQILSVTLFEKTPILQAFSEQDLQNEICHPANQLILFE